MKSKRQVVSEFRRAEIVHAARRIFARKGLAHAIIDEIAQEAGIAKGTIYLYFKSKTEIYKAVLDHDMRALKTSTLDRLEAATSLRDKILAFILARLEKAEANKDFFRIINSDSGALTYTRSQYRDWLREPVHRLASAIAQSAEQGEIHSLEPEKTAWLIADMTRGTIQRRLLGQTEATLEADAEFLLDFIWTALKHRR